MENTQSPSRGLPVAPLGIAALESCREMGEKVNEYILGFRKDPDRQFSDRFPYPGPKRDTYLIDCHCPRFGSGEGKGILEESVRGKDLFVMVDVCNYSLTYPVCGHPHRMSPDDHYQDLKRIISAANGKARRISVIMPFLYEGRQHERTKRESLDCAMALQELYRMGVSNIITFDANDSRVQNAVPLQGFDTFYPPYQFTKALLRAEPDLRTDRDHLMIISPDESAMDRAVYLAGVLGVDMGMFYRRRDYAGQTGEKNTLITQEFLGNDPKGKDVIIIDDMISSGQRVLSTARQIRDRGAAKVFICTTFGLFTEGFEPFDDAYEKGIFDRLLTTNLTYLPPEAFEKPYFVMTDMSKFIALIIDSYNRDISMESVLDPTERIHTFLKNRQVL